MNTEQSAAAITEDAVTEALRTVIDPEVGLNVVDLGLVYGIDVATDHVYVDMTMTTPACPLGSFITDQAEAAIRSIAADATEVAVRLVWEPPWHAGMMSEEAKARFGW